MIMIVTIGFSIESVSAGAGDWLICHPGPAWYEKTEGWGIAHWYFASDITGRTLAGSTHGDMHGRAL